DYNATAPVHPLVAKEMGLYLAKYFGNPSSAHYYGVKAREAVEKARRRVSGFLGSRSEEIVFTSGGAESNNYAIGGVAEAYKEKGIPALLLAGSPADNTARSLGALISVAGTNLSAGFLPTLLK
ncbi:MAG: aminotransferase class V-fold PLP-dependent enzyme, partial [Endomicrobiia bacterium]|nr:aminotransferase class V-fold PLP-dependent enzyme [Endomicrobiia bacterium]